MVFPFGLWLFSNFITVIKVSQGTRDGIFFEIKGIKAFGSFMQNFAGICHL